MLITTIPKSGSKLLKLILYQAGVDVSRMAHMPYAANALSGDERAVCLIRDPRDMVVSLAHYAFHASEKAQAAAQAASSMGELQSLLYASKIANYVRRYDGWTRDYRCLTIRFEDIRGPNGGGSAEAQMESAVRLAEWLSVEPITMREAMDAGTDTTTFRRGVIGAWRDEMEPELADQIADLSGEYMRRWGYLPNN